MRCTVPLIAGQIFPKLDEALQVQARALGDPTRHELFRYLADTARPVDVAELTAHVGLHHNAVRQHLAKLVDAGLVVESSAEPVGRGRPRRCYAVDPAADGRWGVAGPYERLSLLLLELVQSGDPPVEVGRRVARAAHARHVRAGDPAQVLVDEMARGGFHPVAVRRGDQVDIVLQTCPFAAAVHADPETVCALHFGIALGVAEHLDGLVVDELVPGDPQRARCRLRCRVNTK